MNALLNSDDTNLAVRLTIWFHDHSGLQEMCWMLVKNVHERTAELRKLEGLVEQAGWAMCKR